MKKYKLSNLIFLWVISIGMLFGLVRIIIAPVDINEYENRTAEKLVALNLKSYLNSNFQNSVELAAGDQIPFAIELKEIYNKSFSRFTSNVLKDLLAKEEKKKNPDNPDNTTGSGIETSDTTGAGIITGPGIEDTTGSGIADTTGSGISDTTGSGVETGDKDTEKKDTPKKDPPADSNVANLPPYSEKSYVSGYKTYRSQLMYGTYGENYLKNSLKVHADNVSELAAKHPDVRFTAFFLERETDVNLETGFRNENGTYLLSQMSIGEGNTAITILDSFETYDAEFYKTDHHWNYKGSYRGYTTALEMLLPNESPLVPTEEVYLGLGSGSMTDTEETNYYSEEFWVYDFDFPAMTYYNNGKQLSDYGNLKDSIAKAKAGNLSKKNTYAHIYGDDLKDLVIVNSNYTGNGNILVIGSSYDNAVLKLLASHYDELHCVDMRKWTVPVDENGNPTSTRSNSFSLSKYITENNITTVLFYGDDWFWTGKTFYIYD